ncbi:MAG TPA: IS21-like element helper ATPase IstB [Polyangiales bacterium]|nr:IS21-like element helper ATPase IstB [Polyangiales bacterium]
MTHEETIQKLVELKLMAIVATLREWQQQEPPMHTTFEERLALLVDREITERKNRIIARRLRDAKLPMAATLEDLWCDPARGIDKATARTLATGQWIRAKQNVIAVGATGVGKSYIGAALAQGACRQGYRALCVRATRLSHQLAVARADGSYPKLLDQMAKTHVLVLDDFLIAPLKDTERRDLLEVLEDRYGRSSTVITTQLPTKAWHEAIGEPTLADAICDRLVHNAHVFVLKGSSIRKKKGLDTPVEDTNPN